MTTAQIDEIINDSEALKLIAQSYGEIASIRLKKIRLEVERNRQFFNEISSLFKILQRVAAQRNVSLSLNKPRKTVSILITSNYRFYGNINNEITNHFLVNTVKYSTDRIVIGKTGIEFLKAMHYFHPFKILVFNKDLPTPFEIKNLTKAISGYQQILVYYSMFKSSLVQIPVIKDITEFQSRLSNLSTQASQTAVSNIEYILEPELEKMLEFFNNQIINILLDEIFLEAELSRTASRLIAMDQAQTRADDFILEQKKLIAQIKRSLDNTKILETFAAVTAIHKLNNL